MRLFVNIILQLLMHANLSNEQKLKFSHIMFQSQGREQEQIDRLNPTQVSKLKDYYAQKITYDVVNSHIQPPQRLSQPNTVSTSGFLDKICCCISPDQYRNNFDVTTKLFLKRTFATLMVWKSSFLKIGEASPDMYGPFWLTVAYVIILGLAANLNEYFILPQNYKFNHTYLLEALGITALFKIIQPLAYSAIVKCLQGYIPFIQSCMLTGYSMTLYMLPTLFCMIPSQYWHVGMLFLAGLLRGLFLWRNYSSKLTSRAIVMLPVILLAQAFYAFAVFKTMFPRNNGKNFSDGTDKVFHQFQLRRFGNQFQI